MTDSVKKALKLWLAYAIGVITGVVGSPFAWIGASIVFIWLFMESYDAS